MLKFFKSIEKTLIFCLEGLLFVLLFLAFFGPYFSEQTELNAELLRISRISIIPMSTFAVLETPFCRRKLFSFPLLTTALSCDKL